MWIGTRPTSQIHRDTSGILAEAHYLIKTWNTTWREVSSSDSSPSPLNWDASHICKRLTLQSHLSSSVQLLSLDMLIKHTPIKEQMNWSKSREDEERERQNSFRCSISETKRNITSVYLSIYLPTYLPTYLSTYLPTYLSVHPSIDSVINLLVCVCVLWFCCIRACCVCVCVCVCVYVCCR